MGKITDMLREYTFVLSIIVLIVGIIVTIIPTIYYLMPDSEPEFVSDIGGWNFYLIIVGFILLLTGIWYLYSFMKNKKFILEEIETNKRSEFLKKHAELKVAVRHMPNKYRDMVKQKEKQLKIK